MDWASRLEAWRGRLAENPAGVRLEVERALERGGTNRQPPSETVRLHGVLVAACRDLGDLPASLEALVAGLQLGGSPVARVELLVIGASLHLARRDTDAAKELIREALAVVGAELGRAPRSSYSARKRRQWLVDLKASALMMRSEVALWLEKQAPVAFSDALEAMSLVSERSDLRVRIAAISRLSVVLLHFGTLSEVVRVLELVDQADRILARRRVRRSHLLRVLVRWAP